MWHNHNKSREDKHWILITSQKMIAKWKRTWCGTCHMASLFSPLTRTTSTSVCSSSNLLVATFTQHLASHPTSAPLLTTSSPLPSPLTVTSHQDPKGLTPLRALLVVSIHDAFFTTYSLLPSHLSEDSHHEYLKLSYSSDDPKTLKIFCCRNGVLATNIISTASAPHQRCQHPTKGALLLAQASGLATFQALLIIAVCRSLLTTSGLLPGQLLTRLSLGISPLAST